MRNIQFSLSFTQDLLLRTLIREGILHYYALIDYYRSEGIDTSSVIDDIFELKTLYRLLTGKPFRL